MILRERGVIWRCAACRRASMASGTSNVDGASKDAESAPAVRQLGGHRSGVQQPFDVEQREALRDVDRQRARVASEEVGGRLPAPVRRVVRLDVVLRLGLVGGGVGGLLLLPLRVGLPRANGVPSTQRGLPLPLARPRRRLRFRRIGHGRRLLFVLRHLLGLLDDAASGPDARVGDGALPLFAGIELSALLVGDAEDVDLRARVDEAHLDDLVRRAVHVVGDRPVDELVLRRIELVVQLREPDVFLVRVGERLESCLDLFHRGPAVHVLVRVAVDIPPAVVADGRRPFQLLVACAAQYRCFGRRRVNDLRDVLALVAMVRNVDVPARARRAVAPRLADVFPGGEL